MAQRSGKVAVTSGLNLGLRLKDRKQMPELLLKIAQAQPDIDRALESLHYVHFARFLPSIDADVLYVITEFDGEFDAYVSDFALSIGKQFTMILAYMEGEPKLPVCDHPADFLAYIRNHDIGNNGLGGNGIVVHSAYPRKTVLDIIGTSGVARAAKDAKAVSVNRADVQAHILHSVQPRVGLHLGMRFGTAAGAAALLSELLDLQKIGEDAIHLTNDNWEKESIPPYILTVGFAFRGLKALGITQEDENAFRSAHVAFVRGPDDHDAAIATGDVGASSPVYWKLGGGQPVDMVASIYARQPAMLAQAEAALRRQCALQGIGVEFEQRVAAIGEDAAPRLHFGYVDGLSQPRVAIKGRRARPAADRQPRSAVGEFLLGAAYKNVFGGKDSLSGLSQKLAENATFGALRILQQDVEAFENLLDSAHQCHGVAKEWVAAKLMGRWRDGTPLVTSPDSPGGDSSRRDDFDYLPSARFPAAFDDSAGLRCPVGAHARRMNPRGARVAGPPHSRRLLRRGMPFGPEWVAGAPPDDEPRGLAGLFLCADLGRQFEFILRQWGQGDLATGGIEGQQDPIIGSQSGRRDQRTGTAQYRIPRPGQPDVVLSMPRLVKTVGSAYLFMPGLEGIRHLSELARAAGADGRPGKQDSREPRLAPASGTLDEDSTFDPTAKAFREDPFKVYRQYRDKGMVKMTRLNSTWVFSHDLVKKIAGDPAFGKRSSQHKDPAGLLNMDNGHAACRSAIQPLFDNALEAVRGNAVTTVQEQYKACCRKGQVTPIDWVEEFAKPVARSVFFDMFGLPLDAAQSEGLIDDVESALATAPADGSPDVVDRKQRKVRVCGADLFRLRDKRVPGRLFDQVLALGSAPFDAQSNTPGQLPAIEVERLANAATLALAGFLPLQWFIVLATWRLLVDDGKLLKSLKGSDSAKIEHRQVVDELLRFDMSTPVSDRFALKETTVNGIRFPKDERVTLVFASANRDPVFGKDADEINFRRQCKADVFAFGFASDVGDAGRRDCLGKQLVYCVMDEVIRNLREEGFEPGLEDKNFAPRWGAGALFRPMAQLNLRFRRCG